MEILSDAVFHGDVSIGTSTNPKTLILYDGNNTLTIGQTGGTEILKTDGLTKFESINSRYLDVCSLTVSGNGSTLSIGFWSISDQYPSFYQSKTENHFYFGEREPKQTYYIATQDQISSAMCDVAHVQYLPINFDVLADCTKFHVPGANSVNPYSIQLFKRNSDGNGYTVKNVDLGTVCATGGNPVIVVEKSSSFTMSSSDGYEIRLVY